LAQHVFKWQEWSHIFSRHQAHISQSNCTRQERPGNMLVRQYALRGNVLHQTCLRIE
jgi:hypothetical protein